MIKNRLNNKILPAILIFVFLFLLLPQRQARASCSNLTDFSIDDCMFVASYGVLIAVGRSIHWAADQFTAYIQPDVQSQAMSYSKVYDSWQLMRNFLNLFFILVLIIIAFATIFSIERYSYRSLLVPFLLAAILINFSYPIVQYVIALGNGLAAIFMKTIGQQDIGVALMNGTGIQDFIAISGGGAVTAGTGISLFVAAAFALVFSVFVLLAFSAAFIFSLIRIPVLWFLIILSPLAVFCYILPSTKAAWNKWLSALISWTFFLPVYIFFLIFAFAFVGQDKTNIGPISTNALTLEGFMGNIFNYVLTIIFMVGGLYLAKKVGGLTSDGVGFAFGKIEGGVKKSLKGAGRFAWRASRGQAIYEGAKQGTAERYQRIKGRLEAPAKLQQAGVAEFFGDKGAKEKQFAIEIKKQKENISNIADIEAVRKLTRSGSAYQQLAAAEVLRERNAMSGTEMIETYDKYRKNGANLSATKFINSVDVKDLSSNERQLISTRLDTTDLEARRKVAKVMAEKGDFGRQLRLANGVVIQPEDRIKEAANLFATDGDKADIVSKAKKKNLEAAAKAAASLKLVRDKGEVMEDFDAAFQKYIGDEIKGMKVDDIKEMSADTLKYLSKQSDFAGKFKNDDFRKKFIETTSEEQRQAIYENVLKEYETPAAAQSNLVDQYGRPVSSSNTIDLKNNPRT